MLQRFFSGTKSGSEDSEASKPSKAPGPMTPATALGELQRQVEKLRGYHELSKEAIERAYAQDVAGQRAAAAQLYRTALNILLEGLAVSVPTAGLDATHSSTARWRTDMNQWQQGVLERLRDLEASGAAAAAAGGTSMSSGGAGGASSRGTAARPANPLLGRPPSQRRAAAAASASGAPGPRTAAAAGSGSREDRDFDERVLSEVLDSAPSVAWDDVAGLATAKQALHEMVILPTLRADLFQGLRAPARGLLLYGPPGNGKTLLAKALAHEARATFFNISAASLTSRWHGDAEKLVRALFRVGARNQPSIIFIDEIDSILSERSSGEHEASRRLKTEFLVQFDGVAGSGDRVVVLGATNRPWELDDAVRRRLPKRVYVPLPDAAARRAMIAHLLRGQRHALSPRDLERVVMGTDGYSGSDLAALCKEAAMIAIRELGPAIATAPADAVRPIGMPDFVQAVNAIKPSVSREQLRRFEEWTLSSVLMSRNNGAGRQAPHVFGFGLLQSVFDEPFFRGFGTGLGTGTDDVFPGVQPSSTARQIHIEGPDDDLPSAQNRLTGPTIDELPDHEEQHHLFFSSSQPDHVQEPEDEACEPFQRSPPLAAPPLPPSADQRATVPPTDVGPQPPPPPLPRSIRVHGRPDPSPTSQFEAEDDPGSPLLVHLQEGMLRGTPRHQPSPAWPAQPDWLTGDAYAPAQPPTAAKQQEPAPAGSVKQAVGLSVCTPTAQPSVAAASPTAGDPGTSHVQPAEERPARGGHPGQPPVSDMSREPPREAHTFTSSSSAGGSDGIAPARANQSEVGKRRRRPSVRAGTLQAAAAVVSTLPAPPQLGASGAPAAATKLASLSLESQAASKQPQELHQAGRKRLRNSSAASDAAEDPDWQPGALKVGPPPTKRSRRITRPPARL